MDIYFTMKDIPSMSKLQIAFADLSPAKATSANLNSNSAYPASYA
jgi:hypothetical protein